MTEKEDIFARKLVNTTVKNIKTSILIDVKSFIYHAIKTQLELSAEVGLNYSHIASDDLYDVCVHSLPAYYTNWDSKKFNFLNSESYEIKMNSMLDKFTVKQLTRYAIKRIKQQNPSLAVKWDDQNCEAIIAWQIPENSKIAGITADFDDLVDQQSD